MNSGKEFQRLNRRFEQASRKVEEIRDDLEDFINEIDEIKADAQRVQEQSTGQSYAGLNILTLRNALCSQHSIEDQTWVPKFLATIGSGPWESSEFDEFLQSYGFDLYSMPSEGVECVIAGAFDWDEGVLSEQIYNRSASNLKIWLSALGSPQANFVEFLAKSRTVVAGTLVGIGHRASGVVQNLYDWVIIDESGRAAPSELAVAMQTGHRILLVGDHKQLPPNFSQEVQDILKEKYHLTGRLAEPHGD